MQLIIIIIIITQIVPVPLQIPFRIPKYVWIHANDCCMIQLNSIEIRRALELRSASSRTKIPFPEKRTS